MAFETPALTRLKAAVKTRFPDVKFGTYNRRPIAGSTTWSQHSWPNAVDIYFTAPAGDTSPGHQSQLSAVAYYIRQHYEPFGREVHYLLWLTKNHFDHIHIDFWPKGYGTPSTTRGGASNRYQYKDGTIVTQAQLEGDDDLAILTDDEQRELKDFLAYIKVKDSNVGFVKHAIQLIRDHRPGEPLNPDQAELFDPAEYEITIQRKEV